MPDDDSSMISFPGDQEDFDDAPQPFKDHMVKAFEHKAGLGPHPGKYQGPGLKMREGDEQDDRDITDADRQRAAEEPLEHERLHEAGYKKMKAAQTGGPPLGPSGMERTAVQQQGAIQQATSTAGAAQAAQAQAAQVAPAPPPAPGGPVGTTQPYAAQAKETPPGVSDEPPEAPGGSK